MTSKINTISNALLLIGDTTINSLTEGSQRARIATNLYDAIYEAELVSYPWSFARKLQTLALTTSSPEIDDWTKIYQLPTDMITLMRIVPAADYEIYGDKLYTNASGVVLDYTAKVSEAVWPGYFEKLMQYALAKEFAIAIKENTTTAELMYKMYLGMGQKARANDSKQKIQRPIQSRPFITVRG